MPLIEPYAGPRLPEVDKIWVVVPFSRPENILRVFENFDRQAFRGKRLLIVENGPALGAVPGHIPCVVISSDPHPSHAKNEALSFIKRHGGGFFTMMDDDDWYGPGYLDEVAGFAKTCDGSGKPWHFVSLGEGIPDPPPQLFLCHRLQANHDAQWLTGGAISGWAETALPFRAMPAEDVDWSSRMIAQGGRLRSLSIYHYLYRRSYAGAKQAWQISREAFLKSVTPLSPLEFPLTTEGEIDLAIVTGEKSPTEYRVLGQKRFIPVAHTHPESLDSAP